MAAPAVYLDACVHYGLTQALRDRGFEVRSAVDEGTTGREDDAQLSYAAEHGWILVTHNERHFRRLHEAGQEHAGLLILPGTPPLERLVIRASMMLNWIATQPATQSGFFKWGYLQEMLERGYRLPSFDEEAVRSALGR